MHRLSWMSSCLLSVVSVVSVMACAGSGPPPREPAPAREASARPAARPMERVSPRRAVAPTGAAVLVTPEGRLQLPGTILFVVRGTDFPNPNPNDEVLRPLVRHLKAHPEITKIRIEGHTDSRGLASYNLRKSGTRARRVKTWLEGQGIAASRVVAVGCGESKPVVSNRTPEGRVRNQRIDIVIVEQNGTPYRGRRAAGGCHVVP